MCHADLHPKKNIYREFRLNLPNIEEAVLPQRIFPYILPITSHFLPLPKYVSRTLTSSGSRHKICPHFAHIMLLPWRQTFRQAYYQKISLVHLHPKAHIFSHKFHGNLSRFSIILTHMSYDHGNTLFVTVKKMCHGDLHHKTNNPYGFHENRWNIDKAILPFILPIICRYHGNNLFATAQISVLHIFIPRHTSVPSSMEIGRKLRKQFATQDQPTEYTLIYIPPYTLCVSCGSTKMNRPY